MCYSRKQSITCYKNGSENCEIRGEAKKGGEGVRLKDGQAFFGPPFFVTLVVPQSGRTVFRSFEFVRKSRIGMPWIAKRTDSA